MIKKSKIFLILLILTFLPPAVNDVFGLDSPRSIKLIDIRNLVLDYDQIDSDSLKKAISDLQAVWQVRVGKELSIKAKKNRKISEIIFEKISRNNFSNNFVNWNFKIFCKGGDIIIRSYDNEGWKSAIYTICQDILGARWYWPTPLGLEFVKDSVKVFPKKLVGNPSFEMRSLYPANSDYGRRNRLCGGYSFNHNLANIFKKEYFQIYPNAYADLGKKKRVIRESLHFDPHPNFTKDISVKIAAEAAINYFKKNPEAKSFSLSPNDNALYDTGIETQKILSPLEYFRGKPNYTDLIFSFANKVAHEVFENSKMSKNSNGAERYLTMLAYYWTEQSPRIELHPKIIPVLTSDRSQWYDPLYKKEDKELIDRWVGTNVEKIGAWDYYFGSPYPYPRQFNQKIIESIKYLNYKNIGIFFSQLPSMWGLDGAKPWLATQLLWNSELDGDKLLDEFYDNFFGEASYLVKKFYEEFEEFRDYNEGKPEWLKFYLDEAGIGFLSKELIVASRDLIEKAKNLVAKDSRYYKRIEIISEAFHLTELYYEFYIARRKLALKIIGMDDHNDHKVSKLILDLILKRDAFYSYSNKIIENPLHASFENFLNLKQSDPIRSSLIQALESGSMEDLKELYKNELEIIESWNNKDKVISILKNPSLDYRLIDSEKRDFLGPIIPNLKGWHIDFRATQNYSINPVISKKSHSNGIRIEGSDVTTLFSSCKLSKTRKYLIDTSFNYKISPDCRVQIRIDWKDIDGKLILRERLIQLPKGETENFKKLNIPLVAPSNAQIARLSYIIMRQSSDDYIEITNFNFLKVTE